jgi:hypothetical protein
MTEELQTNPSVFAAFWHFAVERQRIYDRRVRGCDPPWSADPILESHRFTNVYRAADRVSQYLIREVISSSAFEPAEILLRVALFRFFNKAETWELLTREVGEPRLGSFDPSRAERVLAAERERGRSIYSAAYIVPPVPGYGGAKHVGHVRLAVRMAEEGMATRLRRADSLKEVFVLLRGMPGLGDFLAYQLAIDLNYSDLLSHDEDEFVVAGPGALDGLSKIYPTMPPTQAALVIRRLTDEQEKWFEHFGLSFSGLFGRRLHLIDVQNLLCEISKYTRVSHPDVAGIAGRTRIKQSFSPAGPLPAPAFPAKWGIVVPASDAPMRDFPDTLEVPSVLACTLSSGQGELFSDRCVAI